MKSLKHRSKRGLRRLTRDGRQRVVVMMSATVKEILRVNPRLDVKAAGGAFRWAKSKMSSLCYCARCMTWNFVDDKSCRRCGQVLEEIISSASSSTQETKVAANK